MGFYMWQDQCQKCKAIWNSAFSSYDLGATYSPTKKCPECGSSDIIKVSEGWGTKNI